MIPYGRQSTDKYDIEAVKKILKPDWLTQVEQEQIIDTTLGVLS